MKVAELIKQLQNLDPNAQILARTWMAEDLRNVDPAFENAAPEVFDVAISTLENESDPISDDLIADVIFKIID